MKMSELEKLPIGTLVGAEGIIDWDGERNTLFVGPLRSGRREIMRAALVFGTLESVWRRSARTGWAMIVDVSGQQWQMRDRYLHVATDAEREAFERDKQRIAQQDAECERFADVLGIERVDVRHGRNVILSWDEVAAIVARLEKGEK